MSKNNNNNKKIINSSRFEKIANAMEQYHGIFSKIWQLGKPMEDESIATAAIQFDNEGDFFEFLFNPEFFYSIEDYTLKFVICHEILHVMLNHGYRGRELHRNLANTAMDVVINESLVADFGFDREKINNHADYCWYDTVFAKEIAEKKIYKEQSFEYYYEYLLKNCGASQCHKDENGDICLPGFLGGDQKTIDQHKGFGSADNESIKKKIEHIISGGLGDDEIDKLKKSVEKLSPVENGTGRSDDSGEIKIVQMLDASKNIKKKKWETVIKKWTTKALRDMEREQDQWLRTNRRYQSIKFDNIRLPSEYDVDSVYHEKQKIELMFFLDTSGSCAHLADRFWKAANSLSTTKFNLNLRCFDTNVYKINLEDKKLYGFGGTMFHILEEHVQKHKKENGNRYIDACFVLTDGIGTAIRPEKPEKWHWFLTMPYKHCIPKESHIYMLDQFE